MSFADFACRDFVATITLNRPERRNAIAETADCDAIADALWRAHADSEVRAIILTGAGAAFCAGGDLNALKEGRGIGPRTTADATRANYRRGVHRVISALAEIETPIIAAINGPAMGLGLDIAAMCDIRIASDEALMASTFVKLGLIPGDGGAWILSKAVGAANAAELILTGEAIGPDRALQIGLISRICPADQLLHAAEEIAAKLALNPAPAVRLAKRLLREAQHGRLSDALELAAAFQALAHWTPEHKEIMSRGLRTNT